MAEKTPPIFKRGTLKKFATLCEKDWRAAIRLIDQTPGDSFEDVVDKLLNVRKAQRQLEDALAVAGLADPIDGPDDFDDDLDVATKGAE